MRHPRTPTDVLVSLASDDFAMVVAAVASSSNTPPDTLVRLSSYESRWERIARRLIESNHGPFRTSESLRRKEVRQEMEAAACRVGDSHVDVRARVASNTSTPAETLARLVHFGYEVEVAGNPSTHGAVLGRIAESRWDDEEFWEGYLARALAGNPSTPSYVLRKLATDPNDFLLEIVARNPQTPVEVLDALAGNHFRGVSDAARRALNLRRT